MTLVHNSTESITLTSSSYSFQAGTGDFALSNGANYKVQCLSSVPTDEMLTVTIDRRLQQPGSDVIETSNSMVFITNRNVELDAGIPADEADLVKTEIDELLRKMTTTYLKAKANALAKAQAESKALAAASNSGEDKSKVSKTIDTVTDTSKEAFDAAKPTIDKAVDKVTDVSSKVAETAKDIYHDAKPEINKAVDITTDAAKAAFDAAKPAIDKAVDKVTDVSSKVAETAKDTYHDKKPEINKAVDATTDAAKNAASTVKAKLRKWK